MFCSTGDTTLDNTGDSGTGTARQQLGSVRFGFTILPGSAVVSYPFLTAIPLVAWARGSSRGAKGRSPPTGHSHPSLRSGRSPWE